MNADETRLMALMAYVRNDPLLFVRAAFPNVSMEFWQAEVLLSLHDGDEKIAAAHGNGAGGTALLCWIALWGMATSVDTRVIMTAGSEAILRTKVWPELRRWLDRAIFRHWFRMDDRALVSVDPAHEMTWRVDAIVAGDPAAFAGLFNKGRRTLYLMDTPALIKDVIWETIEGCADPGSIVCAIGVPLRKNGAFVRCFEGGWKCWHVDTRDVSISNKFQIRSWLDDTFGSTENSDFVRAHVRGLFPIREARV